MLAAASFVVADHSCFGTPMVELMGDSWRLTVDNAKPVCHTTMLLAQDPLAKLLQSTTF